METMSVMKAGGLCMAVSTLFEWTCLRFVVMIRVRACTLCHAVAMCSKKVDVNACLPLSTVATEEDLRFSLLAVFPQALVLYAFAERWGWAKGQETP